ncbi:MAG: RNA-directed DNA polymerase [Chloroflexi bacterium AL-W]|nr:RNA-directed DNA polymerase [Chloroflexi bacterium AL-N1]NOK69965.1 RNA-directed DNA polymerase [Chloroflexi bacterium AL-N10]NOK73737.1 RNA-directed DNA polymerase [Chloroflexi bacterium AL-N5]NOK85497.1 RNA-directed DNA polymerase [Chloroflexi bacterium AL-W]NOK91698.1 RNA-directed DNA polymerase [Chloroflexi bacterium AL-N15]
MSISLSLLNEELKERLFNLQSRKDLADLLEIDEKQLIYHLYIIPPDQKYKKFIISKGHGSVRRIDAPISALKIIQRKLLKVLTCVYRVKKPVHGFVYGRSILSNAKTHRRRRYVLNLDLQDFFPSINFGRVRGMFMARPYHLNSAVATVLAQICCFNNQLPQGAPTSPIVSNMVCAKLDDELQRLSGKYRCMYTRYADDITISTNLPAFPSNIATLSDKTGQPELGVELQRIIDENGFVVHKDKTRLQIKSQRQQVTGLTVNRKVNVRRSFINQVRAMLHAWDKYGLEAAQEEFINKYDMRSRSPYKNKNGVSFARVVKGKIDYLGMIRGQDDTIYLKYYAQYCRLAGIPNRRALTYPVDETLLPLIVTEGKTDWKHLKIALSKLQSEGIFQNLNISFHEYEDNMEAGDNRIIQMCRDRALLPNNVITIFIFDRDNKEVIKKVTENGQEYKTWNNNVFSFAIPVPNHRTETPDVCIELYYRNEEITREDGNKRRLYLSREFNPESARNHDGSLNCTDMNKIRDQRKVNVIDSNIYNSSKENVALPKSDFADYILHQEENFNDFDYTEFKAIFEIIQRIIQENPIT